MTELSWSAVRQQAIVAFAGETPHPSTEQDVIEAFKVAPLAVVRAIDETAAALAAGQVRGGWPILRHRVQAVHSTGDVVVDASDERAKAVRRAECWLRNAGVHEDRESGLVDALFHDPGAPLSRWAGDELLVARLVGRWRELRGQVTA